MHGAIPRIDCFWCHGAGYRLTRRLLRPPSQQAALAQINELHATIRKAAATLDQAAQLLHAAGKTVQAQQTTAAAQALRDSVEGQDA